MSEIRRRLADWHRSALDVWMSNRRWDWAIVTAAVASHYVLHRRQGVRLLITSSGGELADDLQFLVNVLATMSGFLLTAVVFFYGMERGMRLRIAEETIGGKVAGAWRGGVVSTVVAMALLGVASFRPSAWGAWLGEALMILVALRVTRLVKVLFDFIELYRSDQVDPGVPTVAVKEPKVRR